MRKLICGVLAFLATTTSFGAFNNTDWQKFSVNYGQFSDSGLTHTVTLFTLPQKQVIKDFLIKTATPFVSSGGPTNVTWTSITNATASTNTLTKNASGNTTLWDASAKTSDQVASGDTYFEFDVPSGGAGEVIAGLSHVAPTATPPTFNNIDYGIYIDTAGHWQVWESGSSVTGQSAYTYGQTLRIQISGTSVLYKVNGSTVYTHTSATPNYPQFGSASLKQNSTSQLHNGVFLSGSATALLDFGNTIGGTTRYNGSYNLVPAASATNFNAQAPFASALLDNLGASMDLTVTLRSSAPLNAFTAGAVDVWFRTETLP